jgi:type II secretory pathway pseudopilin PulG
MRPSPERGKSRNQQGYVLLTLLLVIALMAILAGTAASTLAWQIQRDREEEMIHRAMQYRRAIRQFAKHKGRYPSTVDELVTSSGLRYLRKSYKDPITGKEFRLLHMWDIPSGANPSGPQPGVSANSLANGQDPNSELSAEQAQNGEDTEASQRPSTSGASPARAGSPSAQPGDNLSGGLIVGVASTSRKKTIREFEHKNRYNQWLFFYDPGFDQNHDHWGPTSLTRIPATTGNPANPSGQQSGSVPTAQSETAPQ